MFHRPNNDMFAAIAVTFTNTFNGEVIRFRRSRGENQFLSGNVKIRGDMIRMLIKDAGCLST